MADYTYLGVIVNPKTREPVHVVFDGTYVGIYAIRGSAAGQGALRKIGHGYYETDEDPQYDAPARATGFPRSHTPAGVKPAGQGFGTSLYTALCLGAHLNHDGEIDLDTGEADGDGISSEARSRSHSASSWWRAAVARGLAEQVAVETEGKEEFSDEEFYISTQDFQQAVDPHYEEAEFEDVSCTADGTREGFVELDVNTFPFENADDHHLIIVETALELDDEGRAKLIASGYIHDFESDDVLVVNTEALLALNVTGQPQPLVRQLAILAGEHGVPDAKVRAMYQRFAVDTDPVRLGGRQKELALRKNPTMARAFTQLRKERAQLGWDNLADLP